MKGIIMAKKEVSRYMDRAAIVALVAAFIYLWNNCEEFHRFWIDFWERESIKEIAVAV